VLYASALGRSQQPGAPSGPVPPRPTAYLNLLRPGSSPVLNYTVGPAGGRFPNSVFGLQQQVNGLNQSANQVNTDARRQPRDGARRPVMSYSHYFGGPVTRTAGRFFGGVNSGFRQRCVNASLGAGGNLAARAPTAPGRR